MENNNLTKCCKSSWFYAINMEKKCLGCGEKCEITIDTLEINTEDDISTKDIML